MHTSALLKCYAYDKGHSDTQLQNRCACKHICPINANSICVGYVPLSSGQKQVCGVGAPFIIIIHTFSIALFPAEQGQQQLCGVGAPFIRPATSMWGNAPFIRPATSMWGRCPFQQASNRRPWASPLSVKLMTTQVISPTTRTSAATKPDVKRLCDGSARELTLPQGPAPTDRQADRG